MNNSQKLASDLVVFMKYARWNEEFGRRETWNEICNRLESMHERKYGKDALLLNSGHSAFDYVKNRSILPSMRSLQFGGSAIESNESRIFNCAFVNVDELDVFREVFFLLLSGVGVGYSVQKRHVNKLPLTNRSYDRHDFVINDDILGWSMALDAEIKWHFGLGPKPYFIYSKIRQKGTPLKTSGGLAPGHEPLKKALQRVRQSLLTIKNGENVTPFIVHDIICHIADSVISGGIRRSACISLFSYEDRLMLNCKSHFTFNQDDILVDFGNAEIADSGMIDVVSNIEGIGRVGFCIQKSYVGYDGRVVDNLAAWQEGKRDFYWWEIFPWRGRSNNSVVLDRLNCTKDQFESIMKTCMDSKSGEPGVFFTNNMDWGTNPCAEIALQSRQFCNLTTIDGTLINGDSVNYKKDSELFEAQALIGTLQAGYSNFPDIIKKWEVNTKSEALLGCSITGIAGMNKSALNRLDDFALVCEIQNRTTADKIGVNYSKRITTVKPEGTSSLVLGTASGVHGYHSEFYLRRIQVNKEELIYKYLKYKVPELIEDLYEKADTTAVITIPMRAPKGAIMRNETARETLSRIMFISEKWINYGHIEGENKHNVSATVNVRDHEWDDVIQYAWENRFNYSALSFFPYSEAKYIQSPFEEIDEKTYREWELKVKNIDLSEVSENADFTNLEATTACAGGSCEI